MGRKKKKQPQEGKRKSMKQLTKGHEQFMKDRDAGRSKENDTAQEGFETLLEKAVKRR